MGVHGSHNFPAASSHEPEARYRAAKKSGSWKWMCLYAGVNLRGSESMMRVLRRCMNLFWKEHNLVQNTTEFETKIARKDMQPLKGEFYCAELHPHDES
ncbi:hypothetical protein CEXT_93491, partial [Caerostris extrusa]